jgi:type I restriction enzyme, S subunit
MTASAHGWSNVRFEDMAYSVTERVDDPSAAGVTRYVGLEHLDPGSLRIGRWGLPTDVEATKLRFEVGDVIFGRRRSYQRKVAVAEFDGICSAHALVLRAKTSVALPEFLPLFMQSDLFFNRALAISVGSLSPTINWATLARQEFVLPPLDEQKRIAVLLWAVEDATQSLRRLEITCARASEPLIEELFHAKREGQLTVAMGDVLQQVQYGVSVRADAEPHKDSVPILRIPNVLRGALDLSELKWVTLPKADQETFALARGDVLLVRTNGNPDFVGRALTVGDIPDRCVFASYLIRLRIDRSRAIPEFVAALINSSPMRRQLRAETKSTAGNYNLNAPSIRRQKIPLPPIEEQFQLVERIRIANDAAVACHSHLAATRALKQRLMEAVLERMA